MNCEYLIWIAIIAAAFLLARWLNSDPEEGHGE